MNNLPNKKAPSNTTASTVGGNIKFEKTLSIEVQHGNDNHMLDPQFPLKNLARLSLKVADRVSKEGAISKYTFNAHPDIPYDSMPYHRVMDHIRKQKDQCRDTNRKEVNLNVRGLTLSQIVQVYWIVNYLDLDHPLKQGWMPEYIMRQFSKEKGVAQLDVDALRAILHLCNTKGAIYPKALGAMEGKVRKGRLSAEELSELEVLRQEFPDLAGRLGGKPGSVDNSTLPQLS
jgi:hypothetical protein